MHRPTLARLITGATLSLAAASAFAHPGHDGATVGASLFAGLVHPFTGADHLLAMAAVGVWSALIAAPQGAFGQGASKLDMLRLPLAFVAMMLVGAALGLAGVTLPAVEPMIAVSLLVIGLLVAVRAKLSTLSGMAIVGGFALFHGYAHGAELPATAAALPGVLAYVGGFAVSTMTLHVMGIGVGAFLRRHAAWMARVAGAGVALYGVGLLVA
ncbi:MULTISPECIES: HupE/UreJ family protein [unclassified Cupriavidus]|uniref:HupE/UreJ family protein n=1 Tax=unclassified Cupriavidus TaxID=2640874 RepID=UPI001C00770B|nr:MULTISPECIES: HupE/UreJ family protein [unclassified Cupriavidus]MCA3184391.1 HupE/UreJ family protein [Cupriavidus sp.]MCA3191352.1 HupE/UreJ family protein [Cupriavidus sp.]MCA3196618.1 HupE/UreJ family protein [Cupriavidus sp.]MCA3203197.1 HupE/UreJ family protein [Cupriavidus sp.]MCA3207536.1 HupE/UreJ family protein [Cupriavidus sp.]